MVVVSLSIVGGAGDNPTEVKVRVLGRRAELVSVAGEVAVETVPL